MPKASSVIRKHASIMMMKMAVRLCLVLGLYIYFSWYQEDENRGVAMTIDCQAFRPISFLFRRQTPLCFEGDWNCVAQLPECVVSYGMVLVLCNIVLTMMH